MKMTSFVRAASLGVAGVAVAVGLVTAGSGPRHAVTAAGVPPIAVSVVVPTDLPYPNGPSPDPHTISLQQAAAFAWEEFIALNWAAVPQHGVVGSRGVANAKCVFGDLQSAGCAGPTVWETFRSKVEIYPGSGNPPGYPAATPAPGSSADPYYGWDALPQYNYASTIPKCGAAPSPGPTASPAWVNLDETDQITLAEMFAGNAPTAHPSPYNSQPQLIRFLAKANRTMYTYIARNGWWGSGTGSPRPTASTIVYVARTQADPPNGSSTLVSFPPGTIEIKSAWRLLNSKEASSHRFHMARARYYELQGKAPQSPCWNEDVFGMVALHIIHKTPSAPYFVYATFEQADNISNADGRATETDDGAVIPSLLPTCAPGQGSKCPTTPTEPLIDGPKSVVPPKRPIVYAVPTPPPATPTPPWCTKNHGKRLYYFEEFQNMPQGGFFCVNARDNPIPSQIVRVNQVAHTAIARHDTGTNDPFRHYKLINVQYVPIDLSSPSPGIYAGNNWNTGANPASFYLANGVVETDRTLQIFSGSLIFNFNSNYPQNFFPPPTPTPPGTPFPSPSPPWYTHKNTAYNHAGYDMGGCMGCHGSQGQSQGGDFSVITARGQVLDPEPPHPSSSPTPGARLAGHAALQAAHPKRDFRNRSLIQPHF